MGNPAPTGVTYVGSGPDVVGLQVSEDFYAGDAQFTVSVDGKQVGGTLTATAQHAAGQDQTFDIMGSFGSGQHAVTVNFLNDAYAGTPQTDRNLYVDGASYDGTTRPGAGLVLLADGPQTVQVGAADTLTLGLSEDAYQGDAQFTVSVDGVQVGGTRTVSASHIAGQSQLLSLTGDWGLGQHTIAVNFLNDAYGGNSAADRNLYVTSASYDGNLVTENIAQLKDGATPFTVTSANTYNPGANGGSINTLGADTVSAGSGFVTVSANGPSSSVTGSTGGVSFIGHTGNDTVVAGSGSMTLVGGGDTLNFTAGSGTSVISEGSGNEIYNIVNGRAGNTLDIQNFNSSLDKIHLSGYAGTGVLSQQSSNGSSQIVLTDNTRITLSGVLLTPNQQVTS